MTSLYELRAVFVKEQNSAEFIVTLHHDTAHVDICRLHVDRWITAAIINLERQFWVLAILKDDIHTTPIAWLVYKTYNWVVKSYLRLWRVLEILRFVVRIL